MANIQDSKVGNLGDILKHAALVELASLIKKRNPDRRVCYLDLHTYKYKAPCSNAKWNDEVMDLLNRHHGYVQYRNIEKAAMTNGLYLCSSALAVHMLETPHLFLAEEDPDTHLELEGMLAQAGVECAVFKYDSIEYRDLETPYPCGPLLALVDPFKMTVDLWDDLWKTVCSAVDLIWHEEKDGLILVFHYSNDGTPVWQEPPSGFTGIIGVIEKPPFYLAVYATEGIADEARLMLKGLGWNMKNETIFEGMLKRALIGIDLAWGSGNSGVAVFTDDTGVTIDEGSPYENFDTVTHRIRSLADKSDFTLVSIDAPLRCPNDCEIMRQWEALFDRTPGVGACPTSNKDFEHQEFKGRQIREFLDQHGFKDVALYWDEFMAMREADSYKGRWYIEVFPTPMARGVLNDAGIKHKLGKMKNPNPHFIRIAKKLLENIQGWDLNIPRRLVDLPTEDSGYDVKKKYEDNLDALLCLLVPMLLMGLRKANASLWHIGGRDGSVNEGCIFTLLAKENEVNLLRNDHQIIMTCLCDYTSDGIAISNRVDNIINDATPFVPTSEQSAIIACEDPLVRVIARAGTGKTTTMVHRTAHILNEYPKANVLMLTFTRNAADEMRKKFTDLRTKASRRFQANTFHGFALKCLLDHSRTVSIGGGLTINLGKVSLLNEFGRQSVMDFYRRGKGSTHELDGKWEDTLSKAINKQSDIAKRNPYSLLDGCGNLDKAPMEVVWKDLLKLYARENLLDFDVIMVLFEYLLRTDSDFIHKARGAITHIIVDEFQDTNSPQLSSVEYLAGYGAKGTVPKVRQVMVVADDFQIIYDWRGAVDKIFERFAALGPCTTLPMHENFRSSRPVIGLVNETARELAQMQEHNDLCRMVPAELVCGCKRKGSAYKIGNDVGSYSRVVAYLHSCGTAHSHITILTRTNSTAQAAHAALYVADIPCDLITAQPSEIPGVRCFLALLTIWVSPRYLDFGAWWYLATVYNDLTPKEFERIWECAAIQTPNDNAQTVASMFGDEYEGEVYRFLTSEWLKGADEPLFGRLIQTLSRRDPCVAKDKVACTRVARALLNHDDFRQTPLRVIGEMTRRDFAGSADVNRSGVQISTIHQYKGLENGVVIFLGDFTSRDKEVDKLRMTYVARSRAMNDLVLLDPKEGEMIKVRRSDGTWGELDETIRVEASPKADAGLWRLTGDILTNGKTGEQKVGPWIETGPIFLK